MTELRPGDRCGDYELLAFIGQGGMAQVWSARSVPGGELVAIKTLLPAYAHDSVLMERLSREGQSQNILRHPNILRSHGTFQSKGSIFMVMDLVDGESLEKYILRRRIMPVPEVRGIAQAVLSALSYAHDHDIVHRDVKPSNILLSRKGRILLSDFGIALLQNSIRLTRYGGMGTPSYMSPEQIVGRQIGPRSDIYSVACVLYELLCGAPPFRATGPDANDVVRKAHQYARPEPMVPRNSQVPDALERAVLRALEKAPANRFESCAAFAAALGVSIQVKSAAENRPAEPGAAGSGHPAVIFPRGHAAAGSVPDGSSFNTPSIEMPRAGTPAGTPADPGTGERLSGGRVQGPISGPGVTTMRHSTPASLARAGRLSSAIIMRRPLMIGLVAIAAGILLGLLTVSKMRSGGSPGAPNPALTVTAPPVSDPPRPATEASPLAAPAVPAPNSPVTGANPALADQPPAQEANPVSGALDQLRQTVERIQADSPAAGGTVGHRPPPLAPPPGSAARSSGVLQWAGGRGDEVEIDGSGATSGILTGDALPGVPVLLWIEGENGSIVQLPSRADGYKRLVLHPDSGRVRIHWKILGTGQSR